MKGMVFTELVEFVEEKFGFEVADSMIEASLLPTKGAYTQAANYSFEELLAIIIKLSEITGIEVNTLIETYARHLFGRIVTLYPPMMQNFDSALSFIAQVDTFIHPQVKKLYPDAELPRFEQISLNDSELVIDYISSKPLIPMAVGLMYGSADYFHQDIAIRFIENPSEGVRARFTVTLNG